MRYYKMIVYVQGEDYETRESLIDEETFRKYQKAIEMGATHLSLTDRVMKISSIKEILPATEIVEEYLGMGITLKQLGIKEPVMLKTAEAETLEAGKKRLNDMKANSGFGKI